MVEAYWWSAAMLWPSVIGLLAALNLRAVPTESEPLAPRGTCALVVAFMAFGSMLIGSIGLGWFPPYALLMEVHSWTKDYWI